MKIKSEKNITNLKIIETKYSLIKLEYKHEHIYTKSTK